MYTDIYSQKENPSNDASTRQTQHPLQKNAHIYIHTHICIRIYIHKNTHAHLWHCSNTLKNSYWDSKSMHKHAYTYIYTCRYMHVYTLTYIYTCRCIHICIFIHTHTFTHIRTHIQHVHMHTWKHAWNDSAAATARGADADARLFRLTPSTKFGTSNARTSLSRQY